ncbi:MAG: ribonuclease P protein component [Dehalococcoidia bacterium]|nr:ribonuclease P protein component [Dehalococcoidia bacterium]
MSDTNEHTWREVSDQGQKAKGQTPLDGILIPESSIIDNIRPGSRGITKEQRLHTKLDFQRVYSSGRSNSNYLLVLRSIPNTLGVTRFGFVVSKRLGNAVKRNRLRRQLKEIVRVLQLMDKVDLVFIARGAAKDADFWQLQKAVLDLLDRAKLLAK